MKATKRTKSGPTRSSVSEVTPTERAALERIARPFNVGFDQEDLEELKAASTRSDWLATISDAYLSHQGGRTTTSCYEQILFNDTVAGLGPAAQAGVDRCLQALHDPSWTNGGDQEFTPERVRESAILAAVVSGSIDQATSVIPPLVATVGRSKDTADIERRSLFFARHLIKRPAGERPAFIAALRTHAEPDHSSGWSGEQLVAGRLLMTFGDEHPAARAWVDALVTGCLPPRRDLSVQRVDRSEHLLAWCEAQADQGHYDHFDKPLIAAVTALAFTGRLPGMSQDHPAHQERASRLMGLLATRTS
jgi:hypothetical protein